MKFKVSPFDLGVQKGFFSMDGRDFLMNVGLFRMYKRRELIMRRIEIGLHVRDVVVNVVPDPGVHVVPDPSIRVSEAQRVYLSLTQAIDIILKTDALVGTLGITCFGREFRIGGLVGKLVI